MQAVEKMPPSVKLTNAVVKLAEARNLVADFVDDPPINWTWRPSGEPSVAGDRHQEMFWNDVWEEIVRNERDDVGLRKAFAAIEKKYLLIKRK